MLSPRQLEKIVKGFSNHRRIQILELLDTHPDLSVLDISGKLKINYKTISEPLRRMERAGLITKTNRGVTVGHAHTLLGLIILKFLRILE